jgi:hypothetical protein
MAHLEVNGENATLKLSVLEILGAFHLSPKVNLEQIESVEIVENPWTNQVLKGVRAPGTGIPLVVILGTMRYRGGRDFCAIYKRRPCAIVYLKSGEFKRWIFEIKDVDEFSALKMAIRQG